MAARASKGVVYAAAAGNLLVTLTKIGAAGWTGSTAMFSEAVHSLVDTGNQLLLLYGIHQSEKPPDDSHPLGYGRELYFWSFVVALLIFTIGAGVSFYEGVGRILHPEKIIDSYVNYIVLGCSAVFEGATWIIALREFRKAKGEVGYFEAVRRSKNPPLFIVLFEDSAALIGLLIALVGTFAAEYLDWPTLDGVAAVAISVLLAMTAFVLARESKGLLIGEPASRRISESISTIARAVPGVERVQVPFTVHLSPDEIVAALGLEFRDDLTTPDIERAIVQIERAIHHAHPSVIAVFVKPQPAGIRPVGRALISDVASPEGSSSSIEKTAASSGR